MGVPKLVRHTHMLKLRSNSNCASSSHRAPSLRRRHYGVRKFTYLFAALLALALFRPSLHAQSLNAPDQAPEQLDNDKPVPLFTGSAGFITSFQGGDPHLGPIFTGVILVPLGDRWLFESRGTFESDMVQLPGRSGFHGQVEKELEYAQVDFIANPYLTITAGRFLTPFGIYNERLYPIWIRNLQSDPLILPIGIGPSNASTGAMLRGGFSANRDVSINYSLYFSAPCNFEPLTSERTFGARAGLFFPKARLEIGGSFQHLLQDERSNLFGTHFIWQPPSLPLDIRAEVVHSRRGSGYWLEPAYRLNQLPFWRNQVRRTQIVARVQQFFLGDLPGSDDLPPANTQEFEFGVNYYFMDGLKGTANYGRQFSSEGNMNVWTFGVTYRFVVPLGPSGSH